MKHFAYSILGCLLLSLNAAFAQKTWSFDGQDPLLSSDGKSLLNLYTIKEIPEFVTGVEGKALRTDGYSTWMDTTTEGDVSSLSGWFALESYPTDTAAFMGIRDMAGTSVAVCVDRYGELLLAMVPYKDGLTIPHVNKEICVGCGGCEYVCPARPFRAIYIEGNPVQKEAKPFKESEEHKVEIDDFGF